MLFFFLLFGLIAAGYGALSGNMLALIAAAGFMAAAVARLTSSAGREDVARARSAARRFIGALWVWVFAAALLVAWSVTYAIGARGDPDPVVIVLWLLSIALLLVSGFLVDRTSRLWQRVAQTAGFDRYDWLAMLLLLSAALFLRIYQLDTGLPAMHGDEGEMGTYARLALFGSSAGMGDLPLPYFRTGFLDHPTLFHYVQSAALSLFGNTMFSLKLLSAIVGALCVPLLYAVARIGWGRAAALAAGWLLTISHLHIQYSRIALNNIETVWFAVLFILLVLLVDALSEPRDSAAALVSPGFGDGHLPSVGDEGDAVTAAPPVPQQTAPPDNRQLTLYVMIGLTVGLSQYFYYGSRLLALLAILLLLLLWIRRRAALRDLVVAALTAVAVYVPLLNYYMSNMPSFINRMRGVSIFNQEGIVRALGPDAHWPDDWLQLLLHQMQMNARFFVTDGDRSSFYMPELPGFDPITVALFWLGLGVLLVQWRRIPAQAILLWFGLGVLLGGVLTSDPANAPRLIVAVPAAFVIAGAAVQMLYDILSALWPKYRHWVAGAAALGIVIATAQMNYTYYFERYAQNQPYAGRVALAQLMADHAETHRSVLMGAPNAFVNHGTLRFVADAASRADIVHVEEFAAQVAIAAEDGQGVLLVVTSNHMAELDAIKQLYTGGESGLHYDKPGLVGFAYYLVPPP